MNEEWLPVKGYEGFYEVSNYGNFRSLDRFIRCTHKGIEMKALRRGAAYKPSTDKLGYKRVRIYRDGVAKTLSIHRLVGIAFIPNPDNKRCINHKDNNPSNNHVSNLEWCTQLENIQHRDKQGRAAKGVNVGAAKLNDEKVRAIRRDRQAGMTHYALAAKYGVGKSTIGVILLNQSWRHVI